MDANKLMMGIRNAVYVGTPISCKADPMIEVINVLIHQYGYPCGVGREQVSYLNLFSSPFSGPIIKSLKCDAVNLKYQLGGDCG
jgi:hypothetical protein